MTADIQKGSRIDLTKTRPDLSQLAIRISWESPDAYDIDAAWTLSSLPRIFSGFLASSPKERTLPDTMAVSSSKPATEMI